MPEAACGLSRKQMAPRHFSIPSVRGKLEPARSGDLSLDFDSKDDPKAAVMELMYSVEWVVSKYEVNPPFLYYWLSEGKGCHLLIPARMRGGEEGVPFIVCIHKRRVHEINEGVHKTLFFAN